MLYKKGLYTEEERSIMNMANINGASIVKYVLSLDNHDIDSNVCYDIVKSCNERYDGMGFPDGLKGDDIPIEAQIGSIVDAYDNLVNDTVNNSAISHDEAFYMICLIFGHVPVRIKVMKICS